MTAETAAAVGAASCAGVGVLGVGARRLLKLINLIERAMRLLFGDETDDIPGLLSWQKATTEKLANLDEGQLEVLKRIGAVEHELHPNDGGSLRDSLNRVESIVSAEPRELPPRNPNQREGDLT